MLQMENGFLDDIKERSTCPKCYASRKFFCYDCCIPMPCLNGRLPQVNLPFMVDIIKHSKEKSGKSTAIHAPVLSECVRIFTFPNIPAFSDSHEVILLYPESSALTLAQYFEKKAICKPIKFILLDCTWSQAYQMRNQSQISKLPVVKLNSYKTQFWRPQTTRTETDLATIEALYYLSLEFSRHVLKIPYNGQYDNLLFFFDYFMKNIRGKGFEFE